MNSVRLRGKMAKKITTTRLIFTLIRMIFLMIILIMFFEYLLRAVNLPEPYATYAGFALGFLIPGAEEMMKVILPYLKQ